ncbi:MULTISPECIES: helix-turn-helix domain-containing protein [unclassified Bradyrhizobium]|uniref:helix-turn-helix domain-containing protein n=1 Tax=unclassified Bradyrhizobium TaxID=2631580 RepID=UPI002FF36DE0
MTNNILTSLRDIRKANNISQESLAVSIGMNSQSGISGLERGIRSPTLATLTIWAEALGYELVLRPKQGIQLPFKSSHIAKTLSGRSETPDNASCEA